MLKRIVLVMTALVLVSGLVFAAPAKSSGKSSGGSSGGGTGIGVILGNPTGLTLKLKPIKVDLAWHIGGRDDNKNGYLAANVDYHLASPTLGSNFNWYYGIGGSLGIGNALYLGLRVPLGLEYKFAGTPFDIFGEIVPELGIIPGVGFGVGSAIGARYNF